MPNKSYSKDPHSVLWSLPILSAPRIGLAVGFVDTIHCLQLISPTYPSAFADVRERHRPTRGSVLSSKLIFGMSSPCPSRSCWLLISSAITNNPSLRFVQKLSLNSTASRCSFRTFTDGWTFEVRSRYNLPIRQVSNTNLLETFSISRSAACQCRRLIQATTATG